MRFLSYAFALALTLTLPFANIALASTWAYEQTFESLSEANLNGQDSWTLGSGSGNITVSTEQAYTGGAKSVRVGADNNSHSIRTVTDANTDGTVFYVAGRVDGTAAENTAIYMWGDNGATRIGDLYMNAPLAGDWSFRQGGGSNSFFDQGNISANTWYCFGIELDFTNDRLRFNVDGGAFGSYAAVGQAIADIDTIWIASNADTGSIVSYWDNFTASPGCGAVAAEPGEEYSAFFSLLLLAPKREA